MDFIDDDENVISMRETARTVGLTSLIVRALNNKSAGQTKAMLRAALRLLGATDEEVSRERTRK